MSRGGRVLSKLRLASRCTYRTCPTHGQEKDNKLGGMDEVTSVGLQKEITERRFKGVIGSQRKACVLLLVESSLFANKLETFFPEFCPCPMQIQRTLAMAHIQAVLVSCTHSRLQFSFSQCDNLRGTTRYARRRCGKEFKIAALSISQNSYCNTAVDFTFLLHLGRRGLDE